MFFTKTELFQHNENRNNLLSDIIYYTKDGQGNVIKFNEGINFRTGERVPITPELTHTDDVWNAGIARHIKDISETEEEAKFINY